MLTNWKAFWFGQWKAAFYKLPFLFFLNTKDNKWNNNKLKK